MKRSDPRLLSIVTFLALVAASAVGGCGKWWVP